MRTVAWIFVITAVTFASNGYGYWQGMRSAQHKAIFAGAKYATTMCVAQQLVEMRQLTRLMEAKNNQPVVLEVAPKGRTPQPTKGEVE